MNLNQIYNAECLTWLQSLPDKSINCCVTSPPYYGLRDYGNEAQIGLEKTPEEYIEKLVNVFHEVYRVLKNDGTLWVNIGDSYAGSMKGAARFPDNAMNYKQGTNRGTLGKATLVKQCTGCKNKDLIGIPWMLAFALRADGWYLRQDIFGVNLIRCRKVLRIDVRSRMNTSFSYQRVKNTILIVNLFSRQLLKA